LSDSRTDGSLESGNAIALMSLGEETLRKARIRIIPFILLLYIVAFLDRINIGFAALTMNTELGINNQQFGLLAGIFFLGYFVFEIPSNLLLHKIGARIWIARILIGWGIVAVLTGFVRNVSQLYLARFLLGLAEAGYFPGIVLYLTYWFPKREQARAIALFMAAIPVASILGAPVSGLILDHIHWFSISSWRWLLALEGFPAIVCGILVYFILPSRPTEATFLTTEEKSWITAELSCEQQEKTGGHSISPFRTLFLPRVWHIVLISFSFQLAGYIPLFWMPQAVRSLWSHYSNSVVGVLLAAPYVFGLAAMILVSRSSDRRLERRYHGAISMVAAGCALILLGTTTSPILSIALWALAVMGNSSANAPIFSLPNEFLGGASAASGIALVTSVGSLGGFVGSYALGWIRQRTGNFDAGLAVGGAALFIGAALMLLLPKTIRATAQSSS
jgi:ACS family tartrate transporter-like MFS transporter